MRIRLALATFPVILLIWLGIAGYLVQKHKMAIGQAEHDARNLAHAFDENIRRTVEAIDTTIRAVRTARSHSSGHFDLQAWDRDSGLTELTIQLSLTDRTGLIIDSNLTQSPKPISIADRQHFQQTRDAANDDLWISNPVLGRVSRHWSIQFVRKLFDSRGGFDGVIVASVDPPQFTRFYGSIEGGRAALIVTSRNGIVRAAAPDGVAGLNASLADTALMRLADTRPLGTVQTSDTPDRVERIFAWRRVEPYGLVVAVGLPFDEALADYRRDFRGCIVLGAALTVISFLVSVLLSRNRQDVTRSREILQAAVENISQGLLVIDGGRRVPVINKRAGELLGLPPRLAKPGVSFDQLLDWQVAAGDVDGSEAERDRALIRSGSIRSANTIYQRTRHNGTVLEFQTRTLASGSAVRTITDVTEQQESARVMAQARDAAEAAARARSEFLSVMTHEIRTPLNGVIGVAGLLEEMDLGADQRGLVKLIRQSGDHLLALINDILDFSRLEEARVQLEHVSFDPAALVVGVVDLFHTQAIQQGLLLNASVADGVPAAVIGDPGRLRQVLFNLVGNAVKFTETGYVKLLLSADILADGNVHLIFSVKDSGIGIAPEAVERMFAEFTQMDASISRRFGGSGLGLAICRRLVELMGGRISVNSEPNRGSTFRFDVTLAPVPVPAERQVVPDNTTDLPAMSRMRVLVAEDNATNRVVALRLLERLGHEADAAGTGVEALIALNRAHYDLVLMDVMMPEMDGLTATRTIRASEPAGRHLAIVGLTAGSSPENLAECIAAGMDAVTTKPVTMARLQAAIVEGLTAHSSSMEPAAPPGATPVLSPRLGQLAEELGHAAAVEIVETFAEDARANLQRLREGVGGDAAVLYRTAHSVKGAARNIGAEEMAARAEKLEHGIGSMSSDEIGSAINALEADLDAVLTAIGGMQSVDA